MKVKAVYEDKMEEKEEDAEYREGRVVETERCYWKYKAKIKKI